MKYHKIFSTLMIGCLLTLASCDDDEKLNLTQYPDNAATITSDANKEEEGLINLRYNEDGKIEETISRTYTYRFSPSPEDIKLTYEIISSNIPANKIKISKEEEIIESGYAEASVTISLTDLDFIKHEIEENYELGVTAKASGFKLSESTMTSKFSINKEAYLAGYSIIAEEGSTTEIKRTYMDGKIIEVEPITYAFKVVLDKPALKDTKVKLSTKNVPSTFENTATFTPNEVTIKAGEKESIVATWNLKNDILLSSTESEIYNLELHAEAEDANAIAADNIAEMTITKMAQNYLYSETKDASWLSLAKDKWSVTKISSFSGNADILIDGTGGSSGWNSVYTNSNLMSFYVDMTTEKAFKGIGIDYLTNRTPSAAKEVALYTSNDGISWLPQGKVETTQLSSHYFSFPKPTEARYIKFELMNRYNSYIDLTEIYVYE